MFLFGSVFILSAALMFPKQMSTAVIARVPGSNDIEKGRTPEKGSSPTIEEPQYEDNPKPPLTEKNDVEDMLETTIQADHKLKQKKTEQSNMESTDPYRGEDAVQKITSSEEESKSKLLTDVFPVHKFNSMKPNSDILIHKVLETESTDIEEGQENIEQQENSRLVDNNFMGKFFKAGIPSKPGLMRCSTPEITASVKCLSNFARIVLSMESEMNVSVGLEGGTTTIVEQGNYLVRYLVWWQRRDDVIRTDLSDFLSHNDFNKTCPFCSTLNAYLTVEAESNSCLIPVTCGGLERSKLLILDHLNDSASSSSIPLLYASISLKEKTDGSYVKEVIGNESVDIEIESTFQGAFVGQLLVKKCDIQNEKFRVLNLYNNGCSVSKYIENFKETADSSKNVVNTVHIKSSLTMFPLPNSEEKVHFTCYTLVCEGSCPVETTCQSRKIKNTIKFARIIGEIKLTYIFRITKPKLKEEKEPLMLQDPTMEETEEETCMPMKYFYAMVLIITLTYGVMLAVCMSCTQQVTVRRVRNSYKEEIESPPRSFFQDIITSRKRTP